MPAGLKLDYYYIGTINTGVSNKSIKPSASQ